MAGSIKYRVSGSRRILGHKVTEPQGHLFLQWFTCITYDTYLSYGYFLQILWPHCIDSCSLSPSCAFFRFDKLDVTRFFVQMSSLKILSFHDSDRALVQLTEEVKN